MEPVKETKKIKKPRNVKVQPEDRKQNKWSIHVKKYCIDNDMKYIEMLYDLTIASQSIKKIKFF